MTDRCPAALGLRRRFVFLCAARRRAALTRLYPHSGTPGCPSISSRHPHLKLVGVPRSLAATRAALPSMSLFPKAQFDLSIHVVQFPSVQWGSRPTALPQTLVRNWSSFFSDVPDSNVKEFCNDFSFGPVISVQSVHCYGNFESAQIREGLAGRALSWLCAFQLCLCKRRKFVR
jgi:hypothetical protein